MQCRCPHCSGEINLSIFMNRKTSKKEIEAPEPLELKLIAELVCENAGITIDEFKNPKRTRVLAKARHQYMWLAFKHTEISKTEIAAFIREGMNHTNVIHGIGVIDDLIETSSVDRLEIDYLFDKVAEMLNTQAKAS